MRRRAFRLLLMRCAALHALRPLRRSAPRRAYARSAVRMMPEGPECHTLSRAMDARLGGGRYAVAAVDVVSGRYAERPPEGLAALRDRLPLALERVRCKGKFIYFELAGGASLWSTLGMSGGWTLRAGHPHARLALRLASDDDEVLLWYHDLRNFGTFKACFDAGLLRDKLESLGLSWLEDGDEPGFEDRFRELFAAAAARSPEKKLAVFLMDQKQTAGIGNYLLSEILYATRTWPFAALGDVGEDRVRAICGEALRLIRASRDAQLSAYGTPDPRPKLRDLAPLGFSLEVYGASVAGDGRAVRRDAGPHGRTLHWVEEAQTGAMPDSDEAAAAAAARASRDAAPSMAWTAKRLQAACRERGLRVSGAKAELLRRLTSGS